MGTGAGAVGGGPQDKDGRVVEIRDDGGGRKDGGSEIGTAQSRWLG